jgi:AcrR family transcriptional regulator
MATKATSQVDTGDQQTLDPVPEWKQQSVDRSLQGARIRAQERTDRFVAATIVLMNEQGGTDFTVQDVVDRSRMSIRTFYNFFESKDDLLVAVYETIIAGEVVPRLRKRCATKRDPIQAIRAYIDGLFDLTSFSEPAARALTSFSLRLAEARPSSLDRAFKPQVELLAELLQAASDAGRLSGELTTEQAAHLVHGTVTAAVHARILGRDLGRILSADDIWQFCAHGVGVRAKS